MQVRLRRIVASRNIRTYMVNQGYLLKLLPKLPRKRASQTGWPCCRDLVLSRYGGCFLWTSYCTDGDPG